MTARPQDVALLPCPFCSHEAALVEVEESGHVVECTYGPCAASTNIRYSCGEDARPLVIEQWNRRANLSAALASAQAREDELTAAVNAALAKAIEHRDGRLAALERVAAAEARAERLAEALRGMVGAAYPVCTSIDPRGHRWCEPYLDEALPVARAALSTNAAQPGETT